VFNLLANWLTYKLLLIQARCRSPILLFLVFSLFEFISHFKSFQLFAFLINFGQFLNQLQLQLNSLLYSVSFINQFFAIIKLHFSPQFFFADFQKFNLKNFDFRFIIHLFLDRVQNFN
jgi:hypothetical protein